MPINQSRYVLIEFDFQENPDIATNLLIRVRDVGAKPVVAHVERYEFIQDNPQLLADWKEAGIYAQVNKGSFLGGFGSKAQKTAFQLLDHRLITVIASDAHGVASRTPHMLETYESLSERVTRQYLDVLFKENPQRICNNQPVLVHKTVSFRR